MGQQQSSFDPDEAQEGGNAPTTRRRWGQSRSLHAYNSSLQEDVIVAEPAQTEIETKPQQQRRPKLQQRRRSSTGASSTQHEQQQQQQQHLQQPPPKPRFRRHNSTGESLDSLGACNSQETPDPDVVDEDRALLYPDSIALTTQPFSNSQRPPPPPIATATKNTTTTTTTMITTSSQHSTPRRRTVSARLRTLGCIVSPRNAHSNPEATMDESCDSLQQQSPQQQHHQPTPTESKAEQIIPQQQEQEEEEDHQPQAAQLAQETSQQTNVQIQQQNPQEPPLNSQDQQQKQHRHLEPEPPITEAAASRLEHQSVPCSEQDEIDTYPSSYTNRDSKSGEGIQDTNALPVENSASGEKTSEEHDYDKEKGGEPATLGLIMEQEEMPPLQNMGEDDIPEDGHDDYDEEDDEEEEDEEEEDDDDINGRISPQQRLRQDTMVLSGANTTTGIRSGEGAQSQPGAAEAGESLAMMVTVEGEGVLARTQPPPQHHHHPIGPSAPHVSTWPRRGSRGQLSTSSQSSRLQSDQQQQQQQQVFFPAAPISPAHLFLARGGHVGGLSSSGSGPIRNGHSHPQPSLITIENNYNNFVHHSSMHQSPHQQQQGTTTRPPTTTSLSNARNASTTTIRRATTSTTLNTNSLGELLRRDLNGGSTHGSGSGGGGTSESVATGSNRSTDTATTAAVGNHARSNSAVEPREDLRTGSINNAYNSHESRPRAANADYNNGRNNDTLVPPSPRAVLTRGIMSDDSTNPSPPRFLRPALSAQSSFPSVVPPSDYSNNPISSTFQRRLSFSSNFSYDDDDDTSVPSIQDTEFFPRMSRHNEWMGLSIESLILGHVRVAPMLALEHNHHHHHGQDDASGSGSSVGGEYYTAFRRRSTASTFGGGGRRRSSHGSFPGGRRGSLSLVGNVHGGTLANYLSHRRRQQQYQHSSADYVDRSYSERMGRRGSATNTGPMYRRRSSMATTTSTVSERSTVHDGGYQDSRNNRNGNSNNGPNIILSIIARETTGKTSFARGVPAGRSLRAMGGAPLFSMLDKPAGGIATDVAFLAAAIDAGDWTETHQIISRLAPRLTGDPLSLSSLGATAGEAGSSSANGGRGGGASRGIVDASLPPTAPKYYAGGGRLGLERDAFCMAGGVQTLIRIFREKSFVGQEMSFTYDARDLSEEIVANRLAGGWNEALIALRELVYAMPALVENGTVLDHGDFLPFLFTLLAHDSCFEASAALIEEILSLLSQAPQQASQQQQQAEMDASAPSSSIQMYRAVGRVIPAATFYLGNVPDLYRLWRGFNCRQLAHFCRILALLVFEPEDRQSALPENTTSTGVMKSIELLQLRRNRTIRAGRDSTVDMNQAILLGDRELMTRLLKLLKVTNFAPSIRRFSPYHVMAHNPFIVDTLLMLGFSEFETWGEVDRQERLARELLSESSSSPSQRSEDDISTDNDDDELMENGDGDRLLVSQLGSIAEWLENLSEVLSEEREPASQLFRIMTTAQQFGLVVGSRQRTRIRGTEERSRPARSQSDDGNSATNDASRETTQVESQQQASFPIIMSSGPPLQGLASFAGMLTDQVLVRRVHQRGDGNMGELPDFMSSSGSGRAPEWSEPEHPIQTPSDAANSLQFNAMILGPYQVEILFVLCTFLGGKRKLDAQDQAKELGMIPILNEMFERLPWFHNESGRRRGGEDHSEDATRRGGVESSSNDRQQQQQQNSSGIHGPGCECTPESALCVQYLRLLHNFCDRDCDNYDGRQLLLSPDERRLVFGCGVVNDGSMADCKPGLLSKIIRAFIHESDESPYRFWLASCIESYLRGSSAEEQLFMAKSGLLQHLLHDVSNERLHCSGSLQTSFDLLGELGKGNAEVFRLLVSELDEHAFRKLLGVAASNLVDSNVFIRSLLLSLERLSAANGFRPLYMYSSGESEGYEALLEGTSVRGSQARSYLTHTWWDTCSIALDDFDEETAVKDEGNNQEVALPGLVFLQEENRQSDWFPSLEIVRQFGGYRLHGNPAGLQESVDHNGWLFTPAMGEFFSPQTHLPNSIERLSWFLAANQGRLLRDLLDVVDLRNINHENICCLNTAVVIAIFAHRRQQLASLLEELRQMSDDERREAEFNHLPPAEDGHHQPQSTPHTPGDTLTVVDGSNNSSSGNNVLRNFREVLWFWREYYTHRGRDRLSLEFSSHLRFQEWDYVVSLLGADDGSALALVPGPLRLPRSPYQRSARGAVEHALLRGL